MGTEVDQINEFEEILCLDPNLSLTKPVDMGSDTAEQDDELAPA